MKLDVKVPAVGESITEAVIGSWTKKSGDFVKMNDVLMLLETDKASVEVVAWSAHLGAPRARRGPSHDQPGRSPADTDRLMSGAWRRSAWI